MQHGSTVEGPRQEEEWREEGKKNERQEDPLEEDEPIDRRERIR